MKPYLDIMCEVVIVHVTLVIYCLNRGLHIYVIIYQICTGNLHPNSIFSTSSLLALQAVVWICSFAL